MNERTDYRTQPTHVKHWIGFPDGETDKEQKQFLTDCFVMTEAIEAALRPDVSFVCGRKGSGKSAVAFHLSRPERGYAAAIAIEPEHYSSFNNELADLLQNMFLTQTVNPISFTSFFESIWSLALYIATVQSCGLIDQRLVEPGLLKPIRKYLIDNGLHRKTAAQYVLEEVYKCLKRMEHSGDGSNVEFRIFLNAMRSDGAFRDAVQAASLILAKHRVIITIDTMERYDIGGVRLFALRGMCNAVKAYNGAGKFPTACVKCFLPAELSDQAFHENRAKFLNEAVFLNWKYSELIRLIAVRYQACLERAFAPMQECAALAEQLREMCAQREGGGAAWAKRAWSLFGPSSVNNRLGWAEDGAAYLFRHTQKRPRDCVCTMNHAIEMSHSTQAFPRISGEDLRAAIHADTNLEMLMSDSLAAFVVPKATLAFSNLMKELFDGEGQVFSGQDLRRIQSRANRMLHKEMLSQDLETLMFRSGLIGIVRGQREFVNPSGQRCRFYLTDFEYCVPMNLVANEQTKCAAHPILADALGLRDRSIPPGIVYHTPEPEDPYES